MYVVRVIPIVKGGNIEELSYFSTLPYVTGTLIDAPLRTSTVPGLVAECMPVAEEKSTVRKAAYTLRKLPEQPTARTLPRALIHTTDALALQGTAPRGVILHTLLPLPVRDGSLPFPNFPELAPGDTPSETYVLTGTHAERVHQYRSRIREAFARGGSVVLVAPTTVEAELLAEALSPGIAERTVLLTRLDTTRARERACASLEDFSTTKLFITTPSFAFIDRHDITTVIIESERSPHWITRTRAAIDLRSALTIHARVYGRTLIFGDLVPRTETEYLRRAETYLTESDTPKRITFDNTCSVVFAHTHTHGPFALFAPQVVQEIKKTVARGGRVFLFAARRGIAPVVACMDCAHIFRSPKTGAPYSLIRVTHTGEEKRWFFDSSSGAREPAADLCPNCGSWRLRERGVGIQAAHDELARVLEGIPLMVFDHLSANTRKKAQYLGTKFRTTPGAVMLGTTMALPYIGYETDLTIVVNADALRATPGWRAYEEAFATLMHLRERTGRTMLIQTRYLPKVAREAHETSDTNSAHDDLFMLIKTGAIEKFYADELTARESFRYPPFAHFVLLTLGGTAEQIAHDEAKLATLLVQWKPRFYHGIPRGAILTRHCLLRLAPKDFPDPTLAAILHSVPPHIGIEINPSRII